MNTPYSSRSAIIINGILGKISSLIGYSIVFIFGLPLILGEYKEVSLIIVALIFIGFGVSLILVGIRIKRRIKRFKNYLNIILNENQTSLESIASMTSKSIDFVTSDLLIMIYKKFFINIYVDKNSRRVILKGSESTTINSPIIKSTVTKNVPVNMITVTCRSCGAANNVPDNSIVECEFCGSPISIK